MKSHDEIIETSFTKENNKDKFYNIKQIEVKENKIFLKKCFHFNFNRMKIQNLLTPNTQEKIKKYTLKQKIKILFDKNSKKKKIFLSKRIKLTISTPKQMMSYKIS